MTPFQYKEANRLYWIVKGHLIPKSWSEKDIMSTYDSYVRRLWGNIEAYQHEVGFEQAWKAREAEKTLDNV
jgi:hypothetical protein